MLHRFKLLLPFIAAALVVAIIVADNLISRDAEVLGAKAPEALASTPGCRNCPNHEHASAETATAFGETCPVCHMLVGRQIPLQWDGRDFYFCSPQCREMFKDTPTAYLQEVCPVCDVDEDRKVAVTANAEQGYTWQGKTYHFCSIEHRDRFAEDPGGYFLHRMWGIPNWLYYLSIALVMLVSFGLFEWLDRIPQKSPEKTREAERINLLVWAPFKWLVRSRFIRFFVQAVIAALFLLIVAAGLWGSQNPARNIAPLLTWTVWWAGLVVFILFAGKAWCWLCPWESLPHWLERFTLWRFKPEGAGLELAWPKALRNIVLATVLFVGLTWVELGFGVTLKPAMTAYLGLGMLVLAFAGVMVFERKSFCRYACLVGRVSGLYALFSPVEVRSQSAAVCADCTTKDCYKGNDKGDGCPTGQFPSTMNVNTYCTLCMECMHTCPHDNMTLRWRPWGADLETKGKPRSDEAYLALLMLSITGFHGLTMTGLWTDLTDNIGGWTGLGYNGAFSLGMFGLMVAPILVYAALVWISYRMSSPTTSPVAYRDYFIRYAYALLPIALFYHLAHNAGHLLMEGQKIVPMLSNPFGYVPGENWSFMGLSGEGPWNLFGTADLHIPPLVSLPALWLIQAFLVLIGHLYSLWAAQKVSKQMFPDPSRATRSQLPMLAAMILFSVFSLWLLKQPMEMRVSAM